MQDKVHTIKPLTRGLPKTGDNIAMVMGDDATTARGWWLGRTLANNKIRFVEQEFVSGEAVISDKATGLMWPKDIAGDATDNAGTKNWVDGLAFIQALDFGGFDDWQMPNFHEAMSLFNAGASHPCSFDTIFTNWIASFAPMVSTMHPQQAPRRLYIQLDYEPWCSSFEAPATHQVLPCRVV